MKLSIRAKLLLLFAGTVLPMVAIGVYSYHNSVRAVEAVVEERSRKAIGQLAAEVGQLLARRQGEVGLLARSQDILDAYALTATEGSGAIEPMRQRLDDAFRQFFAGPRQAFARVYYLDEEGRVVFGFSRPPEAAPTGLRPAVAVGG